MGRTSQLYLWRDLAKDDFLKRIQERMGTGTEFNVPDAAEIFNVSNTQITAWVEEGLLFAIDIGAKDRKIFRMNRCDIMRRAEQLSDGL